jgi:hypothetical protein
LELILVSDAFAESARRFVLYGASGLVIVVRATVGNKMQKAILAAVPLIVICPGRTACDDNVSLRVASEMAPVRSEDHIFAAVHMALSLPVNAAAFRSVPLSVDQLQVMPTRDRNADRSRP